MNISNSNRLRDILVELKEKYGINQTVVAGILDVSIQVVTDMKGGRRTFTPVMAEKLLEAFANEPWAAWLAKVLHPFIVPFWFIPELADVEFSLGDLPYYGNTPVPQSSAQLSSVPLLRIPWVGPPLESGQCVETIMLPRWASTLAADGTNPYALEMVVDDYAGRLRVGDQVLIVQDVWPDKELMIVKGTGGLRLARNSLFDKTRKVEPFQWIALDSGIAVESVSPVATVTGIIMARL